MKAKKIVEFLNSKIPLDLIDSWDNTGFQIGDINKDVKKIIISLDLDDKLLDFSIKNNIDMIITHHPVIFKPLNNITNLNSKGRLIYNLIRADIAAFNAHSNLDIVEGGVNDVLAELLNISDVKVLSKIENNSNQDLGYGRIGYTKEIELKQYINIIKDSLDTSYLTVYGEVNKKINKVAVCGGSGSSFIKDAYEKKADLYITGDIKYHDTQGYLSEGLTVIDAGHFHTEKVILNKLKDLIDNKFKNEVETYLYIESAPKYGIY